MNRNRILRWLIISYLIFSSAVIMARFVLPTDFWLLWAINYYLLILFIPLPIFILINLFLRKWRLLIYLTIPTIGFIFLYGRHFIPFKQGDHQPSSSSIRVVTFNVLNSNSDQAAIAATILGTNADLAGLQEITGSNANPLDHYLNKHFAYHTPLPTESEPQVTLFSRYPILVAKRLHLPLRDRSWETIVELNGIRIKVIVLHLIRNEVRELPIYQWPERIAEREDIRMRQVELVVEAVKNSEEPVLVLCDCNFTEFSRAYVLLDEVLDDSFADVGWGFGHTIHPIGFNVGLHQIDFVWHSSDFFPLSANVVKDGNSDHNPLVVDFDLVSEK